MRGGAKYLTGAGPLLVFLLLSSPAAWGQLPPVATDDLFGLYTKSGLGRILRFENICPMAGAGLYYEEPLSEYLVSSQAFDSWASTFLLERRQPSGDDRVLKLKDQNKDGDANDPGEAFIWYTDGINPGPNWIKPVQLAMAPGGAVLVSDPAWGVIFRL